ncbi:MAG TPA: hypothetical protein VFD70_03020 [Anaerolineae bacterium]|nr:hypothetical protein [Anaerolineae bacterium]
MAKSDIILQRALDLINIDDAGHVTNAAAVRAALVGEFDISAQRAAEIQVKAARRKQHPHWGARPGGNPGAGRPPAPEPLVRRTITLLESHEQFLKRIDPKLSNAIRKLIAKQIENSS